MHTGDPACEFTLSRASASPAGLSTLIESCMMRCYAGDGPGLIHTHYETISETYDLYGTVCDWVEQGDSNYSKYIRQY
jgi:hypothetical protein